MKDPPPRRRTHPGPERVREPKPRLLAGEPSPASMMPFSPGKAPRRGRRVGAAVREIAGEPPRSSLDPRARLPGVRSRGLPGDLAGQVTISRGEPGGDRAGPDADGVGCAAPGPVGAVWYVRSGPVIGGSAESCANVSVLNIGCGSPVCKAGPFAGHSQHPSWPRLSGPLRVTFQ